MQCKNDSISEFKHFDVYFPLDTQCKVSGQMHYIFLLVVSCNKHLPTSRPIYSSLLVNISKINNEKYLNFIHRETIKGSSKNFSGLEVLKATSLTLTSKTFFWDWNYVIICLTYARNHILQLAKTTFFRKKNLLAYRSILQ